MKTLILLLVLSFWCLKASAQNDPSFSQYMFNEKIFNPASMQLTNTLDFSLAVRQQWVGFENAPLTQAFNISTYLQDIYGGVGLNIVNDKLGFENFLRVRVNYAFPVQVGVFSHLVFGVGAGIVNRTIDGTGLIYDDPNDPSGIFTRENFFRPDFSFGLQFMDPNLELGFAVTNLHRSLRRTGIDYAPRHYYLYGLYRFNDVFFNLDLEPYVIIRSNVRSTQIDLNLLAYYEERLWGGLSFRIGDAVSAIIGYAITPQIRIGYSYDYSIGVNRRFSGGSHEIMILTSIGGFNRNRVLPNTPRIFN